MSKFHYLDTNNLDREKHLYKSIFSFLILEFVCIFILFIICNKEDDYINNIPRYLFREKNYLIRIYRMFDNKKKNLLLNLIFDTEKLIRKNKDLSVLIGLRFLLSFKKLVIS